MPKSKIIHNLNQYKPSDNAETIIQFCDKILNPTGFPRLTAPQITTDIQFELDDMSKHMKDAKVIVHEDKNGATILSSSGSIVIVGDESVSADSSIFSLSPEPLSAKSKDHIERQVSAEYTYAIEKAATLLKESGVTHNILKMEITKLDEALPHVIIMQTDKNTLIVADSFGHYNTITTNIKSGMKR